MSDLRCWASAIRGSFPHDMNDPTDQAGKNGKPKVEFLALAEELQSYILSFLPWQDVLRCASVCKALRQTYISSSELQYIIELGGQGLLPVPIADPGNHTSVSQRLQLLRDKAHAWFQFNFHTHSFQTFFIEEQFHDHRETGDSENWAKIVPLLPQPSEQTVIGLQNRSQNLIAIAYGVNDDTFQEGRFCVDLRTLDGDGIHPQATGQTLFLSVHTAQDNHDLFTVMEDLQLKGFGRHLALQCCPVFNDVVSAPRVPWWLQLWDWQHSTRSNSNLSDMMVLQSIDFCFVGNDRLLLVSDDLKLYSIEDMSRKPQLLACYSFPFPVKRIQCFQPTTDIAHGSQMQMPAQQTMWTSDPEQRLLCCVVFHPSPRLAFAISTKIFFDLDSERVGEKAVMFPWEKWGPTNARLFQDPWSRYRIHMMDFSPLAVERRQGLGLVVKKPSTIEIYELGKTLTTSLPYAEVASDRVFDAIELIGMWVDTDRIYLAKIMDPPEDDPGDLRMDQLEVIEMSSGLSENLS
ncbi:hypothetical protein EDD22DRAFT_1000165 [Suillus occidentalis]|nr:hypothetical protein EDD22DRAFT_1000165 [Suillus occidentalis]